ncbi:uncharacterized protein DNG_04639 [Cephalotrichum gorgonifer]|uniref:Uncharacterized protein n=1 Tax=Cephalotrichum gorgonifer TaxID=2041049 RepID=A0AAE8SUR6_9PEZI|nr:uncharacterized protein DNG_04639 [Cephalotrichum gorgonifer]
MAPLLKPLPDCEGPKLEPFTQDITAHDIEFLEIPSHDCAHGIITKVRVDGKLYCLKLRRASRAENPSPAVQKALCDHGNAFNCECRAFGRLKEVGREDIAVRVYGYISLPITKDIVAKMHRAMERNNKWETWDWKTGIYATRDPQALFGFDIPDDGSRSFLGILKDWVGPVDGRGDEVSLFELVRPWMLQRMLSNVKALHRCGIVIYDVGPSQWVDGTLVDLSCAMTTPHVWGPGGALARPGWTFSSLAAWDLWALQTRVIDWYNDCLVPSTTPRLRKSTSRAYGTEKLSEPRRPPLPLPISRQNWGPPLQQPTSPAPAAAGELEVPGIDSSGSIRECLRSGPRPRRYGPFLPILNHVFEHTIDLVDPPPYDPAKFDWRATGTCGGRKSGTGSRSSARAGQSRRRRGVKMTRRRATDSKR